MISKLQLQEMQRRTMPKPLRSQSEAIAVASDKYERELEMHNTFENWLRLNEIPYIHGRFGKIVRDLPPGHPDFTILAGYALHVEFKTEDNALTEAQEIRIAALRKARCEVLVTTSVSEAIHWTKRVLEGGE